ncbi:creatininase family protein [Streptomyces sp. NPDC088745]|uniref:creatininase family protein n=1 Tax=Streptomyces sp. NPDC088745 TaxID=3365884 RepID=UPI0037F82F67
MTAPLCLSSRSDRTGTARDYGELTSDRHGDMHASEIETSILLHAAPELVREGYTDADHDGGARPFPLVQGMSAYTESGVIGYPSYATESKGKAVLESLRISFAAHLGLLGETAEASGIAESEGQAKV